MQSYALTDKPIGLYIEGSLEKKYYAKSLLDTTTEEQHNIQ